MDFLICDLNGLRPLVAIELDDSFHKRPRRQERDALVDELLAQAGLPLLHWPSRRTYDTREIEAKVGACLGYRGV